jgi:uronate dehydrogenase
MLASKTESLTNATVVLTGAAGKVAKRLRAPLSALCKELIVTDILPVQDLQGNERYVACDLANADAVRALLSGVDKVVHFAGYPRESNWSQLIPANILSVTNLWEAALEKNIRRIVYASTNHVVGFHPVTQKIGVEAEYKCDSRYGVTKAFTEITARFYYEKYGIESLGLRIGRVEDAPIDKRMMSTWIHPDDLLQQVLLGLTGDVRADVLYGISDNRQAWCHNPAVGGLQYSPAHRADDYKLNPSSDSTAGTEWAFQGGPFASSGYVGDENRAANFYLRPKV